MVFHSNRPISPYTYALLAIEGLALLGLGLAYTTDYWMSTAGSPPPSAIWGAVFVFFAGCAGIISALMLFISVITGKIDIGTIVAFAPFCGFAIWGVWYSLVDTTWTHNLPVFFGLLGVIAILWLYVIVKFANRRR